MKRIAVPLVAVVLALSGCGGELEETGDEGAEGGGGEAAARCQQVPRTFVRSLQQGLTVQGGGTLRWAHAVRSRDDIGGLYEGKRVWFVSAEIQGPGFGGKDEIGTWATTSRPTGRESALIMAVDPIAREFSEWGVDTREGSPADEVRSMDWHGAKESQACVRRRARKA